VTTLVLMLLIGVALLGWMLAALLRGVPQPVAPAAYGRVAQLLQLPGLSFAHPERLFDPADYEAALRSGVPPFVATALRDERQRLALLWLRLLRSDVQTLWRFRRVMAAHGASADPAEELRVALTGVTAVGLIHLLRLAVRVAGPFRAAALCRGARRDVESIWQGSAALFGRIPSGQVEDLQRVWQTSSPGAEAMFLH